MIPMGVILHFLNEGLLHVEGQIEGVPESVLRAVLIAVMLLVAWLCPTIGVVLLWLAVIRYVPTALARGAQERFLVTAHISAAKSRDAALTALKAAQERIEALERDLVAMSRRLTPHPGATIDPDYHAVGLHDGAPMWLIETARRAYRLRLHPDRHPVSRKQAAHERFVSAEAKFAAIYKRRGMIG